MINVLKKSVATLFAMAMLFSCGMVGMGATNPTQALAEDYPTSQEITISVDGLEDSAVTFTKDDLANRLSASVTGYLYKKPSGEWYVVGAKDSITIDNLFRLARVSSYWTPGATLQLVGTDGVYTKYYPTYEEVSGRANYFYPDTTTLTATTDVKVSTPSVLAFTYCQEQIPAGETAQDVLDDPNTTWTESTRLCVGLTDDTLNGSGDVNMGKRLPYDLTDIIIIPAA